MSDVFGLCMVKNEDDIFEETLNHFIKQDLDHIVILNNQSTDRTEEIILKVAIENPGKISMIIDNNSGYDQADKMNDAIRQYLVPMSSDFWVVPFDADEFWMSTDSSYSLGKLMKQTSLDVLSFVVYSMVPSGLTFNKIGPERFGVVSFRYNKDIWLHDGNHEVTHSGDRGYGGNVNHYQYRSYEQFMRKVRQGKTAIELSTTYKQGFGEHWLRYGAMSDEELKQVWDDFISGKRII